MGGSKRRRRWWPWLLLAFVVALLIIDVGARLAVERVAERELRRHPAVQAEGVDARIRSFPFLGRLLASGETSFTVALEGVEERGLRIDEFIVDIDGLVFDRGEVIGGQVQVNSIDRAEVRAVFTQESISELAGVDIVFEPGQATAVGLPGSPSADAAVAGGNLLLAVEGTPVGAAAIPSNAYLPCDPSVEIIAGAVQLACGTDMLPPVVNDVLGRAQG